MLLKTSLIRYYKCFLDAKTIDIEPDITCMVGQNESGKTAFMESLYRLNPLTTGHRTDFDELFDYPRHNRGTGQLSYAELNPIESTFELNNVEIGKLEGIFGPGILNSSEMTFSKNYGNETNVQYDVNESAFVRHVTNSKNLDSLSHQHFDSIAQFIEHLQQMNNRDNESEKLLTQLVNFDLYSHLRPRLISLMPKFLYFDEFSVLPSRFSIPKVLQTPVEQLTREEITAKALLGMAEINEENFSNSDYEQRKVMLETASREITNELFQYWSQNKHLRVDFDSVFETNTGELGTAPFIDIRIWNDDQRVSLKFKERSKGFIWFFSFLVYLHELFKPENKLVLLLDEPGRGLHPAAQQDLVRFMEERLSGDHQIIYSTHSPFMIDPKKLYRVRTVEDNGRTGSRFIKDINKGQPESLMPVRASLGHQLSQTNLLGPHSLLVEHVSDIIFLQIMSFILKSRDREGLNDRWSIVPSGDIGNLPSWIGMIDDDMKPVILANVREAQKNTLLEYSKQKYLNPERLLLVTDFTGGAEAEIEDMFEPNFYLNLLKNAGLGNFQEDSLPPGTRILERIYQANGVPVNQIKPANYLLIDKNNIIPSVNGTSLDRFEKLFKAINKLIETTSPTKPS